MNNVPLISKLPEAAAWSNIRLGFLGELFGYSKISRLLPGFLAGLILVMLSEDALVAIPLSTMSAQATSVAIDGVGFRFKINGNWEYLEPDWNSSVRSKSIVAISGREAYSEMNLTMDYLKSRYGSKAVSFIFENLQRFNSFGYVIVDLDGHPIPGQQFTVIDKNHNELGTIKTAAGANLHISRNGKNFTIIRPDGVLIGRFKTDDIEEQRREDAFILKAFRVQWIGDVGEDEKVSVKKAMEELGYSMGINKFEAYNGKERIGQRILDKK